LVYEIVAFFQLRFPESLGGTATAFGPAVLEGVIPNGLFFSAGTTAYPYRQAVLSLGLALTLNNQKPELQSSQVFCDRPHGVSSTYSNDSWKTLK
jgi:hypothetical protein